MSTFKEFLKASGIEDQNIDATLETVSFTNTNGEKFFFLFTDVERFLQALWISGNKVKTLLKDDWKYEETKFRQAFGAVMAGEGANSVASNLGSQTRNTVRCLELYAYYLLQKKPSSKFDKPDILSNDNLDGLFYGPDLGAEFQDWLKDSKQLSEKSVTSYAGAVSGLLTECAGKNLFHISASNILEMLRQVVIEHPDFIERNNTGNQMYSSAFNHYSNFLQTRGQKNQVPTKQFGPQQIAAFRSDLVPTGFKIVDDLPENFITALAAKPFTVLTGNSGTGKTKLAELFAQWLCDADKFRLALIPVGADWTDNRNVLGFVNHIRPTRPAGETDEVPVYQSTGILDLLLAAKGDPAKPYFLILDEMNLSHVERYFADFLSAMESRGGELPLHREGRALPRKPLGVADVPETLPLPRNVFVIGTVNVDETTYMFSPKVLDRANVIEFRVDTGAPKKFLESGGKPVAPIDPAPAGYAEAFLELSIRARGLNDSTPLTLATNPPEAAKVALTQCTDTISDLFAIMQKSHQEFAFRSMSEILRFLAVDYELAADKANWNGSEAMDAQILQKILPKLHGSRRKLGSLLAALATYCEAGSKAAADKSFESQTAVETYAADGDKKCANPHFKDSHRKLCEMILTVRRDQFVSFIQ